MEPGDTYDDTGQFCLDGQCRRNAGGAANGVLDLVNAIRVSDDVFFYNLGALTNADPTPHPNGGALQQWARAFGIGRPTGIDLGGEAAGNLPTPNWRNHVNGLEAECDTATGPFKGKPKHAPGGCGIADGTNRPWSIGDNINLAVGQGDVQVTPLQLATAYSAIANGGTVVRPHLGLDVQEPDGTILQRIDPPPSRHLNINPIYLDAIRQGLHDAAQTAGGTSDDVMGNFPQQVYGKTGTAQYNGQQDYSWYVCFVPSICDQQADRGGRLGRAGWLRRGRRRAGRAPDPLAVVLREPGTVPGGVLQDAMSTVPAVTPIRTAEAPAEARSRSVFIFDPLLLLAALGLVACSLITLKGATRNAVPGHPLYYVERQAIYAAIGLLLAALLTRFDYSRLREYKLLLYGLMVALNVVVFATPAIRGSHRWIPFPFLQFQSSEFGKILLVVSLAAFAVDRIRRLHERRTTARIMLLA